MSEELVRRLAKDVGGTIEEMGRLPDGSGFAMMSMPLPKNHWSVIDPDANNIPPMGLRLGTDHPQHDEIAEMVRAAVRYGFRCATMNGKDTDLDPDALAQNVIVGLLGYWTPNGLTRDPEDASWCDPSPVPPLLLQLTFDHMRRFDAPRP